MTTKDTLLEHDIFMTVEVHDPNGHRSVLLEGLRSSASVAEIHARAQSELQLPDDIEWNIRHEHTGRLLQENERLGALADSTTPHVELRMQPDIGLG